MKWFCLVLILMLVSTNVFAYNPSSFKDEETITIAGKRPRVDIEVSELSVTILADDFDETGIAEKIVTISNIGSGKCTLTLEVQRVPVDLIVNATVDTDLLFKNETTNLNISVELTDQQEAEDFNFTILVTAEK